MPASASASRIARTWFVGRQYQSIAARGSTSPGQGAVRPDPLEQLLDERRVLIECRAIVTQPRPVPRDPVVRQLRRRQDREALVVGLEQRPLLVQEAVRPLAPVAGDPGEQHEVVVATGDLERVELERARSARSRS